LPGTPFEPPRAQIVQTNLGDEAVLVIAIGSYRKAICVR
jgi:hypothetical protein